MEIVALELWRALPSDEAEADDDLRAFKLILDSWVDRSLPKPDCEEYAYAIQTVLNVLYQIRKWKEISEAYKQCQIIMIKENALFKIIDEDGN